MHTIIVDIEQCQPLNLLDPTKFRIIDNLNTAYIEATIINNLSVKVSNYDYFIKTSPVLNSRFTHLEEDPINQYRVPKSIMLLKLVDVGISVPNTSFIHRLDKKMCSSVLQRKALSLGSTGVVIKAESLARGVGQIVLEANDLNFFLQSYYLNIEQQNDDIDFSFMENIGIPGEYRSEEEKKRVLAELLRNINDLSIQEFIEDIKQEYRLLLFLDGTTLVYERDLDNKLRKRKNALDRDTLSYAFNSVIDKLGILLEQEQMLFMSVDLYELPDGQLGCFEYSNEFGYRLCREVDVIAKAINNSLTIFINKTKEL